MAVRYDNTVGWLFFEGGSGSRIFAKLVFASSGVHRVAWWDGDAEG
jgi:hypothetical protein